MSWIRFNEIPRYLGAPAKTKQWQVLPKDCQDRLGLVRWHGPWRKYTFQPAPNTVFEQDCLRAIAQFCQQQTRNHKNPRMAATDPDAHFPRTLAYAKS